MRKDFEKEAAAIFCDVLQNIFERKIEQACHSINTIISDYPETQASLKASFIFSLISLTYLNSNCILAENFYTGLKAITDDGLGGFFNPNKKYFQENYDIFAQKRLYSYKRFKMLLNDLVNKDNLHIVRMPINFSFEEIKHKRPALDLICLKDATPIPENKLKSTIQDLNYSILTGLISEVFNIDYVDELNSITKKKMDRVEFYYINLAWLVKFHSKDNKEEHIELIKKCCRFILGLTENSGDIRRQYAYETINKLSQNYHCVFVAKEPLTEIDIKDIDECSLDIDPSSSEISLISLVSSDQVKLCHYDANYPTDKTILALEFNELPEFDIFIENDKEEPPEEEEKENYAELKIEFDP